MGDATRKGPDRFHFLSLLQLVLQFLLFLLGTLAVGDIREHAIGKMRSGSLLNYVRPVVDPNPLSIPALKPVLDVIVGFPIK